MAFLWNKSIFISAPGILQTTSGLATLGVLLWVPAGLFLGKQCQRHLTDAKEPSAHKGGSCYYALISFQGKNN